MAAELDAVEAFLMPLVKAHSFERGNSGDIGRTMHKLTTKPGFGLRSAAKLCAR